MTLIEELEQAARTSEALASYFRSGGEVRREMETEASRLRKRVQRIKNAGEGHSHGNVDPDCAACQMFQLLTGDL